MIGTRGLPAREGGVEKAVEMLSRELVSRGHAVTVYGRRDYCEPRTDLHGVAQTILPAVNSKHLEAISHTCLAVAHALACGRFNVLHLHATGPALLAGVPRILGKPTIVTVQGLDWQRDKWNALARTVLKAGAWSAAHAPHRTIVVSRTLHRAFSEDYARKPTYIPNGVDFGELLGDDLAVSELADGRPFILYLGRLVPEKGVDTLMRALMSTDLACRLVIAGSGTHSDEYVAKLRSLGRSDKRVIFLGPRFGPEKIWLLRHACLFVQPSRIEGLAIALLEALATGCRVLVSDIPENVEPLAAAAVPLDRSTFRVGDASDLARKLVDAVSRNSAPDPGDRGDTVVAAIRSRYDWQRIAAETEQIYREAIRATQ